MNTTEQNVYGLADFNSGVPSQTIQFYKMNEDGTHENGTTLEAVISVCLERLMQLNNRFPCRENSLAVTKLQEALMWLEARTKDRIARGVEGQHIA